jgi:hypothetical protein
VTPERPQTAPHDYQVVCELQPAPTVVGGQAVNLWAINYLTPRIPKENLVSKDLDVVVSEEAFAKLKYVPGWVFQPRETKNWMDSRLGALRSTSPDGRQLLVEILHSVYGLDQSDLTAAAYVQADGVVYRVLDPIAMLKGKAANVRDFDQVGPPPRQDRIHLKLLVHCVPEFLRDVHASAVADATKEKDALAVFTRAFKTLQREKIAGILIKEGIAPRSLLPPEFADSPLERIRRAYKWQMSLVPEASEFAPTVPRLRPSVAVKPKQGNGPRMGI